MGSGHSRRASSEQTVNAPRSKLVRGLTNANVLETGECVGAGAGKTHPNRRRAASEMKMIRGLTNANINSGFVIDCDPIFNPVRRTSDSF